MILSCKSILPLLYERHPDSPFLLPASFDPLPTGSYVRKPIHAREGANIQVVIDGKLVLDTEGPYQGGPYVYQALAPIEAARGPLPGARKLGRQWRGVRPGHPRGRFAGDAQHQPVRPAPDGGLEAILSS